MIKTTPEQNKTLVLQAFDKLFNKRDPFQKKERYWSSNSRSTQHNGTAPIPVRD